VTESALALELKDASNSMLSILFAELSSESEVYSSRLTEGGGVEGGLRPFIAAANSSSLSATQFTSTISSFGRPYAIGLVGFSSSPLTPGFSLYGIWLVISGFALLSYAFQLPKGPRSLASASAASGDFLATRKICR